MANPTSNGGSQGGMEGISELLRCYICMERLSDATICPHCSKLGCYSCIERWIAGNKSNCPHCRMTLTLRDLIKIPLFDDLGQHLDTLPSSKKPGSSSPTGEGERCPKHKEKMSVYCETCKKCICHMCALFGGNHADHKFKPLEELYKGVIDKLKLELHHLKDCMKEVMNCLQVIEKKMDAVKVTKSKTKRDIQHSVDKMYGKLDEQAKEKLATLSEQRHHLKKQALEIAAQSHELEKLMSDGNVASLVGTDGELKTEVREMLKKLRTNCFRVSDLPSSSDFVNEVTPSYVSSFFKIHPFRDHQCRGEELYSKPMKVHGQTWRLKVYPNGHREENGNYLSAFVELSDGFERTTCYQYSIEMLYNCNNKHPHKNYKREYASEFANGECWGYKKYFEISKLQEEGFLKDNMLVLKFSVRAPTYYQKCRDLTDYVEKVELDNATLKKELEVSRQQVAKLKTAVQASTNHSPTHSGSSQQILVSPRRSHSQSQHQHSNSAPHDQPPHHGHERQSSDELRRYYHPSASQQPLRSHSHHASPKRTYLQPSGHSDSRLHPEHHYPGGMVVVGRSGSRDEHDGQRYVDQRRRSADPSVMMNYDHQAPYRNPNSQPKEKRSSRPQFEELGNEEGSSQSCEILTPAGITFTLEETVEDIKSASSTSTLVELGSNGSQTRQPLEVPATYKALSQEVFGEDERHDTSILSTVNEGVPLSSQPLFFDPAFSITYYGLSQPSPPKSRHGKSLTDITSASTGAPHVNMGGNSNLLALRSCLSQSVELPHFTQPTQQRYTTDSQSRHSRMLAPPGATVKHMQSVSHNKIHRMASDSHLNYEGPPGQKMSVLSALSRTRGEIEQKKQPPKQRSSGPSSSQTRKQYKSHHLQKKHVQATVVSQTTRTNKTSSPDKSPRHRPERSPSTVRKVKEPQSSSSTENGPASTDIMSDKSTKSSVLSSNGTSRDLVFQGKSKSTSCLNLQQLL